MSHSDVYLYSAVHGSEACAGVNLSVKTRPTSTPFPHSTALDPSVETYIRLSVNLPFLEKKFYFVIVSKVSALKTNCLWIYWNLKYFI